MIPQKALKPIISKGGRDYTKTAVEIALAYKIFSFDGKDYNQKYSEAEKIVATRNQWVSPSNLPEYYDGIDSHLNMGKDTEGILAIRRQLKEFYGLSSASTETAEDTRTPTEPEPVEEIKKSPQRNVNHPKLYPELQKFINPRYMWGQRGLYDLQFKSDIDKAIYYAGGSSKDNEGYRIPTNEKKLAVREWIFAVTGLSYHDDYDELREYRKRILEYIITGLRTGTIEDDGGELIIPPIYDGTFDEPDNEEDYDDEEEDDIEPEGLDDLLDFVKVEEELPEEKEVAENIEEQIVDAIEADDDEEGDIGSEDDIPDELLQDELDPEFVEQLVVTVNKRKNKPRKPRTGSYVTNTKIFKFLTTNLYKIQGQLDSIDKSLQEQTQLVQANLQVTSGIYENLDIQNEIIGQKLDAILQVFNKQTEASKQLVEDEERRLAEQRLESQIDVAGTETPADLRGKGTTGKKRQSRISQYYRRKLLRQAYRKLPKKLRSLRTGTRRLQKIPGKISTGIKSSAANRITRILPKKATNFASNLKASRAAAQGMGGVSKLKGVGRNIPGVRQALSALEYSERKSAGQSEVQAIAGVGGSLAGAAAGAALGTMLFPGVGTVAGLLIGAAFSAAGSMAGSKIADISTGADKINGEHEVGGLTKPGTAILHGTEAIVDQNIAGMQPVDPVGGTILAATTQYINKLGPIGAPIAPMFEQVAAPLAKIYDVPNTLVQANVGGSLPSLQSTIKKVRDKKKKTPEEELGAMEKDLLETKDPDSFADKLLKMLDPEGKFQELLKNINNRSPVGETGEGMAIFGESGIDKGTGYNAEGWVHGHFQNSSKQALINDTVDVVKQLVNKDVQTVITSSNKDITKDMSDAEIRKHVEAGIDGHKKYGPGVYAIDVSVPAGTAVPFELENVYDSNGPGGIVGTMKGRTTQIMHLAPGSKAGAAPTSNQQLPPGQAPVGVTKNEVSKINDTRNPSKLMIGAGHIDTPGRPGSGQGTASGGVREAAATQHMLRALQSLIGADPALKDKVGFSSFNNDNFARDNANKFTNKGMQFLELHFDQRGGGGRSGLIPSRNARAGVTGNAGTSGFDVALSKHFGNYGSDFKRGDLGIPDTGGSILELGAIDANKALLKEVESGTMGPETMKLARYTYNAVRAGAAAEGWISPANATPPTQRQPAQSKYYLRQGADKKTDTQIIMIPASSNAGKTLERNATTEGVRFSYNANYNTFDTSEIPSSTRALVLRRLGLN
jgi:hypothetical protein